MHTRLIRAIVAILCYANLAVADESAVRALVVQHHTELREIERNLEEETRGSYENDTKLDYIFGSYEQKRKQALQKFKAEDYEAYVSYLETDYLNEFHNLKNLKALSSAYRDYAQTKAAAYAPISAIYDQKEKTYTEMRESAEAAHDTSINAANEKLIAELVKLLSQP